MAGVPHIVTSSSGGEFVVKGDRVSFVSKEQVARVGAHPLDDVAMPSDAVLPKDFLLLHDPTGRFLRRCDFYMLPYHQGSTSVAQISDKTRGFASDFYGKNVKLRIGNVDIPKSSWHRVSEVAFIRYRRLGIRRGHFEHPYEVPVWLYDTSHPAWRVALPTGCVVDARGFVWP